jgi:hypothetical protein
MKDDELEYMKDDELEKEIRFYYMCQRLKTIGLKMDFDELDCYSILCRNTGDCLGNYDSLEEVGAFYEAAKIFKGEKNGSS